MSTTTSTTPSQRQRIFMTGASGYIGSVLTEFAIAQGYLVYGLSRSEKSDTKLRNLGATPIRGDLHSLDVLSRESAQAHIVINLADPLSDNFGQDYAEVLRIDAAAVSALAEPLKGTNKPLIITSGSLVVAPDPTGAETTETSPLEPNPLNGRIHAEQHALRYCKKGVHVCAIRLAPYVYGRGGSGIKLFMQMAAANKEVTYVADGNTRTSTVHVDDAARLYLLAAQNAKPGETFNATSATDVTAKELAEAMGAVMNVPVRGLSFEEMEGKMGPFFARFLTAVNRAGSGKAREILGWKTRERGVLEDIREGSYVEVARELRGGGK